VKLNWAFSHAQEVAVVLADDRFGRAEPRWLPRDLFEVKTT
jgi:hypothetical protein